MKQKQVKKKTLATTNPWCGTRIEPELREKLNNYLHHEKINLKVFLENIIRKLPNYVSKEEKNRDQDINL